MAQLTMKMLKAEIDELRGVVEELKSHVRDLENAPVAVLESTSCDRPTPTAVLESVSCDTPNKCVGACNRNVTHGYDAESASMIKNMIDTQNRANEHAIDSMQVQHNDLVNIKEGIESIAHILQRYGDDKGIFTQVAFRKAK